MPQQDLKNARHKIFTHEQIEKRRQIVRKTNELTQNTQQKKAETACGKGHIQSLYNITRQPSGRPPITNSLVKDSNGNVISKNEEQLKRWKEHFQEVLNRPPPIITPDIEEGLTLDINIENISRDEMERAIRKL